MSTPNDTTCPSFDELSMAFSGGTPGTELGEHLATCEACASIWRDLGAMRDAAKALPWAAPTPERAEALEAELLERALFDRQLRRRSARRVRVALTAGAIAASIIAAFLGARGLERSPEVATPVVAERAKGSEVKAPDREVVEREAPAQLATTAKSPEARIRGSSNATFAREIVAAKAPGAKTEEIMHLSAGSMTLEVPALEPDRRFVLVTDDAEVIAQESVITATAEAGRLTSVEVVAGRVELRPKGGAPLSLEAGERWPRPTPPTEKPVTAALAPDLVKKTKEPAPKAVRELQPSLQKPEVKREPVEPKTEPTSTNEPRVEPKGGVAHEERAVDAANEDPTPAIPAIVERPAHVEAPHTPGERAFAAGWAELRKGDTRAAIARFEEAEVLAGSTALAEDASYWKAVALGRAKRTDEAIRAMTKYLDDHGSSARSGEVRAMLGWQWMEKGAVEAAAARFTEALRDPSPRVKASAERGLAAVEAARAP